MADPYFKRFPATFYSNTLCRDITRRVKFDERTKSALTNYYTYVIQDGTRADLIADAYYDDPQLDWMLWLTNDIVDPYYDWHLSYTDFTDYLIKKYGSVEAAQKRIIFYRNNWYDDDNQVSVDYYNNHLDNQWKKYYAPFYGNGTRILYYKRREEDWVMETNKIYKLTVANTTNYIKEELVDVYTGVTRSGGGEISEIANTYLLIKNIDGSFANNDTVTGEVSNNSQTVANVELMYEAIGTDEGVFWSSVSYYDIENERNEYNKTILVLDKDLLGNTLKSINTKLKE